MINDILKPKHKKHFLSVGFFIRYLQAISQISECYRQIDTVWDLL